MRIIQAVERKPIKIPIGEVMDASGHLEFVPEVKSKGYFDIDYRKGELVVVAGKYIGQVPLTPTLAIQVTPKVPLGNLTRIIGLANQPIRCLEYFRRKYTLKGEAASTVQEAIAQSLLASLRELDAEGVFREYRRFRQASGSIRGRIDIPAYVSKSLSKGVPSIVPCIYFGMTVDTLYNRIIKRAITEIGNSLSLGSPKQSVMQELAYFLEHFDNVKLDASANLISQLQFSLEQKGIPDLRSYYLDILDVSSIILAGTGVELIEPLGSKGMHSLVIDLEDAFEQYVRAALRQSTSFSAASIIVQDGNKEGKGFLFSSTDLYEAKPDIILRGDGGVVALGDVKYKVKLDEKDRYQLIAHSVAYGARKAFFVTPVSEDGAKGPSFIGTIGHIDVYHYRMDLDTELASAELELASWVSQSICGLAP